MTEQSDSEFRLFVEQPLRLIRRWAHLRNPEVRFNDYRRTVVLTPGERMLAYVGKRDDPVDTSRATPVADIEQITDVFAMAQNFRITRSTPGGEREVKTMDRYALMAMVEQDQRQFPNAYRQGTHTIEENLDQWLIEGERRAEEW